MVSDMLKRRLHPENRKHRNIYWFYSFIHLLILEAFSHVWDKIWAHIHFISNWLSFYVGNTAAAGFKVSLLQSPSKKPSGVLIYFLDAVWARGQAAREKHRLNKWAEAKYKVRRQERRQGFSDTDGELRWMWASFWVQLQVTESASGNVSFPSCCRSDATCCNAGGAVSCCLKKGW